MRPAGKSSNRETNGYSARSSQAGAVISAAELIRKIEEVARDHVPVALGREVLGLAGAVLLTRHEDSLEAQPARHGEIVVVRRDQRALIRLEPEHGRRAEVTARLRLVEARDLRAENRIPRQSRALGHVDQERHVAVGQRGEDVLALEPREARHGIGPRIEAMPGAVEIVEVSGHHALDAELSDDLAQALPVEVVELGPSALAASHFLH